MEETEKMQVSIHEEKSPPRGTLSGGILTVDVDAQVETAETQEDARWHQIVIAHRSI